MFKFILATVLMLPINAHGETNDEIGKEFQESLCTQLTNVYKNTLIALKQKNDYTDILYYYHIQLKEEDDNYAFLIFNSVKAAANSKYETVDHKKLSDDYMSDCKQKLKVDIIENEKIII